MSKEFDEIKPKLMEDGTKKMFAMPASELAALAAENNKKNEYRIPEDAENMQELNVSGNRLLKIRYSEEKSEKAIFIPFHDRYRDPWAFRPLRRSRCMHGIHLFCQP